MNNGINLTYLLERSIRVKRISDVVEMANPTVVQYVSKEFLEKSWDVKDLQRDLCSEAIEDILDELRSCDYKRIISLYKKMKLAGLIKERVIKV
jgi:predicted transcriptional regulator